MIIIVKIKTTVILYINDICNVSSVLNFTLFADDTNIFCSHDNVLSLCRLASNELDKLSVWFAVNKLSLNVDKTNYMIFDNRKVPSDLHVSINGTNIERVNVTKFLGVLIDCNLSWKDQINNVSKKLSKSIAVIRKASFVLNSDALYTLLCFVSSIP